MLDVSSRLADDKSNDIRIEAAIAKLYASELGWQVLDELMQVRGGRGYETAESLKARGEKPVPVEQVLRDMRINRIFEGSTEIMHLLIAREAVDQHLQVAGDILEADGELKDKAKAAVGAGKFYAKWLRGWPSARARSPARYDEFGELADAPALRRAPLAQARALDLLRDGPLAGQARAEAGVPRPDRRHRRRAVRDRRRRSSTRRRSSRSTPSAPSRPRAGGPVLPQARRRADRLFDELWANDDDDNYDRRAEGARRPLRVARGGHRRPVGRRADDRRAAARRASKVPA